MLCPLFVCLNYPNSYSKQEKINDLIYLFKKIKNDFLQVYFISKHKNKLIFYLKKVRFPIRAQESTMHNEKNLKILGFLKFMKDLKKILEKEIFKDGRE